ncbi:MAG: hypothetical protein LBD97_01805 [Bifidobacteriaceae bacterium]|jgi:hypothetical protein|nr:hypothetical protein [Bifidobacteriaceae bacterium]
MRKTTVYLDEELVEDLGRAAKLAGKPAAEIIRAGTAKEVESYLRVRPKMKAQPTDLGGDLTPERIARELEGFGA